MNWILISLIILALAVNIQYIIRTYWIVLLTIKRGILAPNCSWWKINDMFKDTTGVKMYYELKHKHGKIAPLNIYGSTYYLIMDNRFIRQVLDQSPDVFGVGQLKYDFFESFMKYNVGVSTGCPWKRRRFMNERALGTSRLHRYSNYFNQHISHYLDAKIPTKFEEFKHMGKTIAMNIVFGKNEIYQPLFDMFDDANSLRAVLFGPIKIDKANAINYIRNELHHPKPTSLMSLIVSYWRDSKFTEQELIDQVPHWLFPIAGSIAVTVPRVLVLLYNHSQVLNRVRHEIINPDIRDMPYLRRCLLETFRLNNPVNSTFRTLLTDYDFDGRHKFKRGDQFLILNNPVLRDPHVFPNPNRFIPERWNRHLEDSYYAIMFNQGPQKCPGKDLALLILQTVLVHYLRRVEFETNTVNTENIPQMINPCKINIKI